MSHTGGEVGLLEWVSCATCPEFGVRVGGVGGGVAVVWVSGEVDVASAGLLRDAVELAISDGDRTRLLVDVSGVTFMDAAGIGVLVLTNAELITRGGAGLAARGARGLVRRIFELTGLAELLDDDAVDHASVGVATDAERAALDAARGDAHLSVSDVFFGYLALGGTASLEEFIGYLTGHGAPLDRREHDIAVHAVNERLIDADAADRLLEYASG